MNHPVDESGANALLGRKPVTIALLMILMIVVFYLLREHWGHVSGLWPYLLLLACPVMHLFHSHGGHGSHGSDRPDKRANGS